MTTILLADDHQLVRQALRKACEDAGFEVVGEAADGAAAVHLTDKLRPSLVLMDISMPTLDGVEATRQIHAELPDTPILVLTMHTEDRLRVAALAAGAVGFLTKEASMQELVSTIRSVLGDDVALSPEIASSILDDEASHADSPLTKRETEILQAIANGLSTTEAAEALFISAKTVKNHLAAIYGKLDARDRTQAVLAGVRMGIVKLH